MSPEKRRRRSPPLCPDSTLQQGLTDNNMVTWLGPGQSTLPSLVAPAWDKLCPVQRALEWFLGLNWAKKVLAVLFAALLLFSVTYLLTTAFLYLRYGGGSNSPTEQGGAPNTASSGSSSALAPAPHDKLSISAARWEGEKAVVEGTWKGDISSAHCDLLEGGTSGKATRWWDRSVATKMNWSSHTFTQEFVAAKESGEKLDRGTGYSVACTGWFSGGWQVSDAASVKGTPPAV